MSSPAMASILPSPRPSSSSLAGQHNLAQRPLPPSSSSATHLKPASSKSQSSRLAPAPSSVLAPAPSSSTVQSPPKPRPSPLAPTNSASPASSTSSSSAASLGKKDANGGPLVQPSKEWVLPARAKPGRKPSETEPLTKRKAQNRASQRAFRERKQSYLADLEAKVAAYEAAEIDRSVEIQKVAQKLRAENETLRKEVGVWKEKFAQIEKFFIQAKANGGRLPGITPSVKSGPGCKAPAHERVATAPTRGVLVAPGAKSGKDKDRSAGGVRFADAVPEKTQPEGSSSTTQEKIPASVPLRRRPSSSSVAPGDDLTPSAPAINVNVSTSEPQLQPAQPLASAPRKGAKPPLWSFETPKPPSPTAPFPALSNPAGVDKTTSLLSPSLLPHGGHLSVEGGCGFCTEASPCVCADDFLDLSSAQSQPSHIAVASDVPSALPLPKRNTTASSASETSRRMSIGSLTHANDVALDQRRRNTTKLWYTVTQPDSPSPPLPNASASSTSVPLSLKSSKNKGGKKLWTITEASTPAPAEPVCTGDPSTCGACSTDPGLAAFCEAVTTATTIPSSSTTPAASSLSPTRPGMLRSGTTCQLPSSSSYNSSSRGETIPSAWRQIRSHPRFSQWQGGLDLLAEVVSKRSGNVHSPLLPHASTSKRPREASVEIEPARTSTSTSLVTSNDRATAKPVLLHTASDTSIHAVTRVKMEDQDEQEAREQKRRRIVIDREAVQEALALLDAGTAAQPRGSVGLGIGAKDELPCPCPWRPGERRSP
ncbi:uncharacterized protein UTRI_10486_B [Ustilago trichophora]|uniref:BZIP domain-containing protein n=1 Tax=Ustilago trichophora TaxID=86804 RepID=A0A5C3EAG6_9BASI|nr:uncharacterized protein UTRI_10486_B [Ustilago trichophora]